MRRKLLCLLAALLLVGTAFAPAAAFAQEQIGMLQFNPNSSGGSGNEFDILNITGVNAAPSPFGFQTTPTYVTNEVDLSGLSLTVSGSNAPYPATTFTLDSLDGISWTGSPADFTGATSATLTGTFGETTLDMSDGSFVTIDPTFSATISDPTGLTLSDFEYIVATNASTGGGGTPVVPEPEPFIMVGTGLAALAGIRRRFFMSSIRRFSSRLAGLAVVLAFAGAFLMTPTSARASAVGVNLATSALPSSGLAGVSSSTLTASNFPTGETPSTVTLSFATTCGGTALATEAPTSLNKYVGTIYHIPFAVPAGLATGNYFISLAATSPATASIDCSELTVTATSTTLASCVPTSSLAVVAGTNVDAYVPNGSWDYGGNGIERVPLEGGDAPQIFTTPGRVNSCAANSATGEVICVEGSTNVDLISGPTATTVTTITSGLTGTAGFSGGSCQNCGVGVNAANNTAVIAGGFSGHGGDGVQFLNLANNTFGAPFPMFNEVSEDISIDPGRNLILSPGESGNYTLLQIGAGNTLTEFGQGVFAGEFDSAAEDCTTGIALASLEFTDSIYITDLTQAVFTPGTPGSWTGSGQVLGLGDSGYSAGTCGISSAPGTNHLGVVTGEFGGQAYAALQLPSTSGSGVPTLADWAYVSIMPAVPPAVSSVGTFSAGTDPHTVTAYTSPNSGKSFAVFAGWTGGGFGTPAVVAVVDLSCVLTAPRSGLHIVAAGAADSCVRYLAVP
jgi:hypothetical protein